MAVLPRNICIVAVASVLIAGCAGGSLKSDHTVAQERVQSYLAANSSLKPAIARAIGRMGQARLCTAIQHKDRTVVLRLRLAA